MEEWEKNVGKGSVSGMNEEEEERFKMFGILGKAVKIQISMCHESKLTTLQHYLTCIGSVIRQSPPTRRLFNTYAEYSC